MFDAANVLHDAGDNASSQAVKTLAESSEIELEKLRRKGRSRCEDGA
jgi:hypothetical protein